jgi:mycoredoxin
VSAGLECQVYFDSRRQVPPPASCGEPIDIAREPVAVERLAQLGLAAGTDLPALLLSEPGGRIRVLGLRLGAEEIARLAQGVGLAAARLTVFSSAWCSDCRRAKRVLDDALVPFSEVDLDLDPQAEQTVLARSGGRRVVPTLLWDDRLWAFNPEPPLLRKLLSARAVPV